MPETRQGDRGPHVFALVIPPAFLVSGAEPEWLSAQEKIAHAAMRTARRRAQFAAGRWLLRHAGSMVPGGNATSLSHSGDRVLCAIAPAGRVGVDVERVRARREWAALASFALHPAEREPLEALEERPRWQGFYRVWTLKEALAKALGMGLALPFNRILFSADNRIEAAPRGHEVTRGVWHFYMLALGAEYAAAAAWREDRA